MSKIEELREKLASLREIYISAKENFRFCYHLHYSEVEEERKYLAIDRHLHFIRHSLWRLTVIESCKIFSTRSTDKYNIQRLITNLRPGGHFSKLGITKVKLSEWEDKIANKKKVIEDLNNLRDKLYAHSDPNRAIYKDVDIYFKDISELLEFANEIIRDISVSVNEPVLIFSSPFFESHEFDLVKILARDHIIEVKKIQGLLNG